MSLTPEQLAQRALGVSASEVAAVVGLSPYEGPWGVWAKKKGHMIVEMNDAMLLGHLMEEPIAQMYARQNPGVTMRLSDTLTHPTERWAMATPDRIVTAPDGTKYLLECKTGGPQAAKDWGDADDEIPPQYFVQVQWQLYVTGLTRCDVAGYIAGAMRYHEIPRHDAIIASLVTRCREFYDRYIAGDEEPAIDFRESTTDALSAMYPSARTPLRDATEEESSLVTEYLAAHHRLSLAEQEKERLANAIRSAIGDAEGFRAAVAKATWKTPEGGMVKWKAVAEAMKADAALIAAHTTPYGRRLDVRAVKEKKR